MCTIYVYFHLVYVILNKYSYLALTSQTRFSYIHLLVICRGMCSSVQYKHDTTHHTRTRHVLQKYQNTMTLSDGPSFRVKIQYLTFVFHWGGGGVQVRSRNKHNMLYIPQNTLFCPATGLHTVLIYSIFVEFCPTHILQRCIRIKLAYQCNHITSYNRPLLCSPMLTHNIT